MSQAASQWAAFARDVAKNKTLWTIRDDKGLIEVTSKITGETAVPFWSTLARVQKIIKTVYLNCEIVEMTWDHFHSSFLPLLDKHKMNVGVNWSGPRAIGYDMTPKEVTQRVEYEMEQLEPKH